MTAALRLDEPPDPDTYCSACRRVVESDGACPHCDELARVALCNALAEEHLSHFGIDTQAWLPREAERRAWFAEAMAEEGATPTPFDWLQFDERCWSVAAEECREIARDWRTTDEERETALDVLASMGIDLDPEPACWPEPAEEPADETAFPF